MSKKDVDPKQLVTIEYTNHRGERHAYTIAPRYIHFGATSWHPEPQHMLNAWVFAKDGETFEEYNQVERDFAMRDIHAWRPVKIE